MGLGSVGFLIMVNILLLVAGNFMEPSSIILNLAPSLFPVAMALGIDPVHVGIIITVNLEIGMITPPVGLNCSWPVASRAGACQGCQWPCCLGCTPCWRS